MVLAERGREEIKSDSRNVLIVVARLPTPRRREYFFELAVVNRVDSNARVSRPYEQNAQNPKGVASLQQLLSRTIPAPADGGAMRKIAQVAKHAAIAHVGLFASLIALLQSVGTDKFENTPQKLRREGRDVVMAGDGGPNRVVAVVVLIPVCGQLGARPEVLQKTHDSGMDGTVGRQISE